MKSSRGVFMMLRIEPIPFYFDFLSPYSFLASARIASASEFRHLVFDARAVSLPMVFASLGVKSPALSPARRRAVIVDVQLLCQRYGFPFVGPPVHPFRSAWALRCAATIRDSVVRMKLVHRLFWLAWAEGRNLEDVDLLRGVVSEMGISVDDPSFLRAPEARKQLQAWTKELVAEGGFGVPTFLVDGLVFFGHDRLSLLSDYVAGTVVHDDAFVTTLCGRSDTGQEDSV